jgi:hypothetical protein
MGPVELGAQGARNEPTPRNGNAGNHGWGSLHGLFPSHEVDGAGIRSQSDKLRERNFRLDSSGGSGIECFRTITGQAKDK